jgi:ComF family protein
VAYEYPVTRLIGGLKYGGHRVNARVLAEVLTIRLREAAADGELHVPDVLVPVPLHPRRQLQRRFNQAELIARCVAGDIGLPVATRAVRRLRHTPSQTGLNRRIRQANLRRAFKARSVEDRHVAVIDDVMTTGTTLFAVARALRAAGAASVQGWVVARA